MALLTASIIAFMPVTQLKAEPLSKERCKELGIEYKELKTKEPIKQMEKGFEWARENIKGDDLNLIKTYLDTQDQLLFRCKNVKLGADKPKVKKIKTKDTAKPKAKDLKKDLKTKKPVAKKTKLKKTDTTSYKPQGKVAEKKTQKPDDNPKTKKQKISIKKAKSKEEPGFFDDFLDSISPEPEGVGKKPKKKAKKPASKPKPIQVKPFFLD